MNQKEAFEKCCENLFREEDKQVAEECRELIKKIQSYKETKNPFVDECIRYIDRYELWYLKNRVLKLYKNSLTEMLEEIEKEIISN